MREREKKKERREKERALAGLHVQGSRECFVPSFVEIGLVVLEKKSKIGKVYRQTDGWTNRRRTTGNQKSSLELSAQVS